MRLQKCPAETGRGPKALMAHALWYAAELAVADADTAEWL